MKLFILIFVCVSVSAIAKGSIEGMFGVSLADEVEIDGAGAADSDIAFILGARYVDDIQNNFGFQAGSYLETIRDVGSGGELGFLSLFGNITYDLQRMAYVFFGLNLPFIIYEDKNLGDVDSVLGVQFGSGYYFTNKLSAELFFRTTNFEIGGRDSELWGGGIQMAYKF